VAALLRDAGWQISDGRVERLWRREGLKVPMKQPKRGRLWLNYTNSFDPVPYGLGNELRSVVRSDEGRHPAQIEQVRQRIYNICRV